MGLLNRKAMKRVEHRFKLDVQSRKHADLIIANEHAGEVMSKSEILRLFGYSPKTYIHDTAVKSAGLIKRLSNGRYKVVCR